MGSGQLNDGHFLFNLQLKYLNLGCNEFEDIPECLLSLATLQTLHLFNNRLTSLPNTFSRKSELPACYRCIDRFSLYCSLTTVLSSIVLDSTHMHNAIHCWTTLYALY